MQMRLVTMRPVNLVAYLVTGLACFTTAMTITLDSSKVALNHLTIAETKIGAADEQLLVITDDGLQLVSLQSNSSALLFNGSFSDVAYESVHGEVVTLVEYENKSQVIILWDSNDFSTPRSLKLTPETCWNAREFETESGTFRQFMHNLRLFHCHAGAEWKIISLLTFQPVLPRKHVQLPHLMSPTFYNLILQNCKPWHMTG